MNRLGVGLAVGAGYVLGRTKKLKLAFAVGTLVAGKRMQLSPRALADLVSGQLRDNPQLKEIGDQLREDLRGVGKAASGAMVERQISAMADRLHGRTAEVRDQIAGVVPDTPDLGLDEDDEEAEDEYEEYEEEEPEEKPEPRRKEAQKRPPAKKAPPEKKAAAKKTAGKTAQKAAAKKAPAKKAAAKKPVARKTASARTAARGARSRVPKGGGER